MTLSLKKLTVTTALALSLLGAGLSSSAVGTVFADSDARIVQMTKSKTFSDAAAIALKENKTGQVSDIDLKVKKNTLVYEVEVVDGNVETKYRIDANTGAILRTKVKTDYDRENQVLSQTTVKKDLAAIEKAASADYKSATIKSIDLKAGTTSAVYEVELIDGYQEITAIYDADTAEKLFENIEFDD